MRLNEKLTPVETTSLLNINSTYIGTPDFNYVAKNGKVIEVSFRAPITTNIPNNTTIFTLPYKAKFNSEVPMYLGGQYDYSGGVVWGYIAGGTNFRDVRVSSGTAGQYLKVQFVYIAE